MIKLSKIIATTTKLINAYTFCIIFHSIEEMIMEKLPIYNCDHKSIDIPIKHMNRIANYKIPTLLGIK